MRSMFETALYFTYFRSHLVELHTLVRDPDYFIDKKTILTFHKTHTDGFIKKQEPFGLLSGIKDWYSEISAIVHGQIPGKWVTHKRLQDIAFKEVVCKEAVEDFVAGVSLIHNLLLCTIDMDLWYQFTKPAKAQLLKGLSADMKNALSLPSN